MITEKRLHSHVTNIIAVGILCGMLYQTWRLSVRPIEIENQIGAMQKEIALMQPMVDDQRIQVAILKTQLQDIQFSLQIIIKEIQKENRR